MEDITATGDTSQLCHAIGRQVRKGEHQKRVKQVLLLARLSPLGDQIGLYHSADAAQGQFGLPQVCINSSDYKKAKDPRIPGDILHLAAERVMEKKLGVKPTPAHYLASFRGRTPHRVDDENITAVDYHVMVTVAKDHSVKLCKEESKHFWFYSSLIPANFAQDVAHKFMSEQKKAIVYETLARLANKEDVFLDDICPHLSISSWVRLFYRSPMENVA